MTTTFFLVRHAVHDRVATHLIGRLPGVSLGAVGREQAARLAERLRRERFQAVHASPRERTQETAAMIAGTAGKPLRTEANLDEVDFGDWSGRSFAELDRDPLWQRWNAAREIAATAGGETMAAVQGRVARCIEELRHTAENGALVLVTHAEIIKAAVCRVLGLSFGNLFRFEIAPASISTIVVGSWGAKLTSLNETLA